MPATMIKQYVKDDPSGWLLADSIPSYGVRVLIWDSKFKEWKTGKLGIRDNTNYWILDTKIFHSFDVGRFPYWMALPESPE